MANNQRICLCCGKTYRYCSHCDEKKFPTWYALFHDENCHDIWYILSDFESGILTKEEAQEKMKVLNPSVITNKDALVSYRKLFDIAEEPVIDEPQDGEVQNTEPEVSTIEEPAPIVDEIIPPLEEAIPTETHEEEHLSVSEELKKHNNNRHANKFNKKN